MQITEVRKNKASLYAIPAEKELAHPNCSSREDGDFAVGARPPRVTQGDHDDKHYWGHCVLDAEGKEATAATRPA